jgi:hypothetical protein
MLIVRASCRTGHRPCGNSSAKTADRGNGSCRRNRPAFSSLRSVLSRRSLYRWARYYDLRNGHHVGRRTGRSNMRYWIDLRRSDWSRIDREQGAVLGGPLSCKSVQRALCVVFLVRDHSADAHDEVIQRHSGGPEITNADAALIEVGMEYRREHPALRPAFLSPSWSASHS